MPQLAFIHVDPLLLNWKICSCKRKTRGTSRGAASCLCLGASALLAHSAQSCAFMWLQCHRQLHNSAGGCTWRDCAACRWQGTGRREGAPGVTGRWVADSHEPEGEEPASSLPAAQCTTAEHSC